MLPEIVCITSYPPRECGIATFSQDLIRSLNNQFHQSFKLTVAALETEESFSYTPEVNYSLKTTDAQSYKNLAKALNRNQDVALVMIQHEFGLYHGNENDLLGLMDALKAPSLVVFHTVLPEPDSVLKEHVIAIAERSSGMIVMTGNARQLLIDTYGIDADMITVIPHGTHLVKHVDKTVLKEKYDYTGKHILSTFGLISSGKNIETTLQALPAIVEQHPDVLFLVIGKTHPEVVKREGESYREMLQKMTVDLGIEDHVQFVNNYISLPQLLEYLQMTDLYLFTSKDPNQAVSGTFSYALSCGCPIVSTPIPHALEILKDDHSMIVPFSDPEKLAESVNRLLSDEMLLNNIRLNGLHRMAPTSWENTAIHYTLAFEEVMGQPLSLNYRLPKINLHHIEQLTTSFGMIQFSQLNQPDINSGYTLDDNSRALIAICQHYGLTKLESDLKLIGKYLSFIGYCQQPQGYFLNYVDEKKHFTEQNFATNLSDSNGRAIWALGYLISMKGTLPETYVDQAETILKKAMLRIPGMHSTRAMAFAIKGLYYYNTVNPSIDAKSAITLLGNRLVHMYMHESHEGWEWFESYMTYANSLLPEAMLCAYEVTNDIMYRGIAKTSFDFLLSHIFTADSIKVISNNGWMHKGVIPEHYGEQPIDVAYTVLALSRFHKCFRDDEYLVKMQMAFNWFLGQNHLHRIIYNPCTGGCWDGLEEHHVNLNQGAESTVSYLMARLTIEIHKGDLMRIDKAEQLETAHARDLGKINARRKLMRRKPFESASRRMGTYPQH